MISIVFRDVLLSMLMGLLALVLLAKPPVDDPNTLRPAGNLIVTITWPQGNSDVDLWLSAPGEDIPVGYSNKDGKIWNLLRDDTGLGTDDVLGINYENAFSRGLPEGEYIINVHAYRVQQFPMTVKVEVALNGKQGGATTTIYTGAVVLDEPNQELTAIRFKIDKNGQVVPNSMFKIFQPLRNGTK